MRGISLERDARHGSEAEKGQDKLGESVYEVFYDNRATGRTSIPAQMSLYLGLSNED